MKIVADENIPGVTEYFKTFGDITTLAGREITPRVVADADMLLVRSVTPVNDQLLAQSSVQYVASATTGIDHIDTQYLAQRGIHFAYAPGANARSVVEYMLAALAYLYCYYQVDFFTQKIGIVGLGNVGGRLYNMLTALGIDCVGFDPLIAQDSFANMQALERVLAADIVCLHTPLTQQGTHATHHLLNAKNLARLSDTVVINAGRGAVIDNAALLQCMKTQRITALLDVWENEPQINQQLLASAALATPHIAGYSVDGKLAATRMLAHALAKLSGTASPMVEPTNQFKPLLITPGTNTKHTLCQAILGAYPIEQDDRRCREMVSLPSADIGAAFDRQRKGYWPRREFSHYEIVLPTVTAELSDGLRKLGFQVRQQ